MWRYCNPVDVKFGAGVFETLGEVLAGRPYCLVTYDDANGGGVFADLTRRVIAQAGAPAVTVSNIGPNPLPLLASPSAIPRLSVNHMLISVLTTSDETEPPAYPINTLSR